MNYGENSFKYKLSLESNIPNKLYKNRKFTISIKLMPSTARSSKIIINSTYITYSRQSIKYLYWSF